MCSQIYATHTFYCIYNFLLLILLPPQPDPPNLVGNVTAATGESKQGLSRGATSWWWRRGSARGDRWWAGGRRRTAAGMGEEKGRRRSGSKGTKLGDHEHEEVEGSSPELSTAATGGAEAVRRWRHEAAWLPLRW